MARCKRSFSRRATIARRRWVLCKFLDSFHDRCMGKYIFEGHNLLVSGAKKQGKTAFMKHCITNVLEDHLADDVIICIFDTKCSGEYDEFEFSGKVRIFKSLEELFHASLWLLLMLLSPEKQLNPQVYLFIDEYAELVTDKYRRYAKLRQAVLTLARSGRDKGIIVTLATDQINSKVLTEDLINCFTQRVCFRVDKKEESELIFPNHNAGAEYLMGNGEMMAQFDRNSPPIFTRVNIATLP